MKNNLDLPNKLKQEQKRLRTLDYLLSKIEKKEDLTVIGSLIKDSYSKGYEIGFYTRLYKYYKENLR